LETPQHWNLHLIKRFMVVFGLLSSVFDFLFFGILLFVLHGKENVFQTSWFIESVVSAILIVLVLRTRLPFFKSLPGKYLSYATLFILFIVLGLPFTSIAVWFGFTPLPLLYYGWALLVTCLYLTAAELTKHWFYKRLSKNDGRPGSR